MLFHSWADIGRVTLLTLAVFLAVVAMLRVVGPRALAKMSGYDVVFTVTLGSVVADAAVDKDLTLSEALAALVTMLVLQEIVRRLQSRNLLAHHIVRQSPRVVLWDGNLLEDRLHAVGVSADEVRAAVRRAGLRSLGDALAVVLENDGDWSVVVKGDHESDDSALFGLPIPGRPGNSPEEGGDVARPVQNEMLP